MTSQHGINDNGVPMGEIEHHGIIALHLSHSWQPHVRQGKPLCIARNHTAGQHIVDERGCEGCFRDAGAIGSLAHIQVISHEHTSFHGPSRNGECFEDKCPDDAGHDDCPEDRFAPLAEC